MPRTKKYREVQKDVTGVAGGVVGDLTVENARLRAQVITLTEELETEKRKRKQDRKRLMEKESNLT